MQPATRGFLKVINLQQVQPQMIMVQRQEISSLNLFWGDHVATDNAIMPREVSYDHCYYSLITSQSCPKTPGKILKDRPIMS